MTEPTMPERRTVPTDAALLSFLYRNHRGEVSVRRVIPSSLHYDLNEWYPVPQWLLRGYDLDRRAEREFAFADIIQVPAEPQAEWLEAMARALAEADHNWPKAWGVIGDHQREFYREMARAAYAALARAMGRE